MKKIAIMLLLILTVQVPIYAEDKNNRVISISNLRDIVISNNLELKMSENSYKSKKDYYDKISDQIDDYESKISKIKNNPEKEELLKNYKDKVSDLEKIYDKKNDDLKIERLKHENKIESVVEEAEQKYINYALNKNNRIIKEQEEEYNEKINTAEKIKYDMGRISKNEYNKNLIDNSDIKIEVLKLKHDEELSYAELKKCLGIDNEDISIDENIDFDNSLIQNINFENDFDQMIENNKVIKIKKINQDTIEDDDESNEYDEDNAELDIENEKDQLKIDFREKYNNLINAYISLKNENNKVVNQENLYNVSSIKFKNGYLSNKEYENVKINLLKEKQEYIKQQNNLYIYYSQYIAMKNGYDIEGGVAIENE